MQGLKQNHDIKINVGGGIRANSDYRNFTLRATFVPDENIYCELENYGQVYRRGSIFTPEGTGITLGRNVVVKLTGDTDYDRFLIQHETGHISDINQMGKFNFYNRTLKEYYNIGIGNVYSTPGTLEFSAQSYAYKRLGYIGTYYSGIGPSVSYTFP